MIEKYIDLINLWVKLQHLMLIKSKILLTNFLIQRILHCTTYFVFSSFHINSNIIKKWWLFCKFHRTIWKWAAMICLPHYLFPSIDEMLLFFLKKIQVIFDRQVLFPRQDMQWKPFLLLCNFFLRNDNHFWIYQTYLICHSTPYEETGGKKISKLFKVQTLFNNFIYKFIKISQINCLIYIKH